MSVSLPSYNLLGLHVEAVAIEVEVARGMPHFSITGMPSTNIKESRDRIRSAIESSGYRFPLTRKIVHLAPAESPKRGNHFDLPMALGLLAASGQIEPLPPGVMAVGELGLHGGVRKVTGLLPGIYTAKENGVHTVIFPQANCNELPQIEGIKLKPVRSLKDAIDGGAEWQGDSSSHNEYPWSLTDIQGHPHAKRALMIAAAGGHHVLMHGPPGTGKSLLARAFPSLLPTLPPKKKREVQQIYSVAGHQIKYDRPFRKVHQQVTRAQLMGGMKPGELSLAHQGVLYLDELPEFKREVLESLRQPLEDGHYSLMRQHRDLHFPSRFQLIASMNPCPCGYASDPQHQCKCHPYEIARYQKKLSGPLMDRIDLYIEVPRLCFSELTDSAKESIDALKSHVQHARDRQIARQGKLNSELTGHEIRDLEMAPEIINLLETATTRLGLSGRGIHKCIKLAMSIADLEGRDLTKEDVQEALGYRQF